VRLGKADLWAKSHPDEWATIYAQQTGVPLSVAKAAIPRLALTPILIDDALVASEQQLADAFTQAGQLPGKVDISGFVDRRYNPVIGPLVGIQK